METRTLNLDKQPAITVTLPNGCDESRWGLAFSTYILPPGDVNVDVTDLTPERPDPDDDGSK